jgi:hypothetical protein
LFALVATLLLTGCNDDDDCADCPPTNLPPQPTLANIWPHVDGTQWVYDIEFNQHLGPEFSDQPPPLPSFEELHAALQLPIPTELLESDEGLYRLRFEGQLTTESGVTAQKLVGRIYTELGGPPRIVDSQRSLLLAIARARPDCRAAILAKLGLTPDAQKSLDDAHEPFFLGAYAFAFEDSGYYGYGDLSDRHSWIYLEGDLAVGTEFSIQLVPELIDNAWLYGRIWAVGDRVVEGVAWSNVVECMYAIDLGVQTSTDENGEVIGSYRTYYYGATLFVPEFGPIACDERHVLAPEGVLGDPLPSYEEYRCRLAGG